MFLRRVIQAGVTRTVRHHRTVPRRTHDIHVRSARLELEAWGGVLESNRAQEGGYQRIAPIGTHSRFARAEREGTVRQERLDLGLKRARLQTWRQSQSDTQRGH